MRQNQNINKEKEINNTPIGIASISKINQKNQSYIPSSRTETKNSKNINIFKPVPKTIVPTKKFINKYQENKKEENKKINEINYRHNTTNSYQRNIDNSNQQKKYYAKCPHCNFVLNDEEEVKKYYNNLNKNDNDKKIIIILIIIEGK